MADNIKISELVELTSGSLSDGTIFPVVDGGTTKKASLSSLQSYLTDDLATDAELSSQISNINSTINGLDTDDITEGTNQYYTDAKVKSKLNVEGVVSGSSQIDIKSSLNANTVVSSSQQISASAAAAGFGTGGGGGGGSTPAGTVSSSAQTIFHLGGSDIISGSLTSDDITDFSDAVSSSAASAGFGASGGGGGDGSTDYVSNVTFTGTTLTFTGQGSAFANTVDLSGGDLVQDSDLFGYLVTSVYQTDSASFASRVGGGGGSVPAGTVSSSAQTIENLPNGTISASAQIDISGFDVAQMDLTSLTADDIGAGSLNKFYTNQLVLDYINSLEVLSGSIVASTDLGGTGVISQSQQIINLGFPTNTVFGTATASLQSQIDAIDSGVNLNDVNVFLAKQKFTQDIEVTGSILLNDGVFSGSGASLFNIPAAAIVGASSNNSLTDGGNTLIVDNVDGLLVSMSAGDMIVSGGHVFIENGFTFSGSGAGLTGIPGTAIEGGVDGQKISSASFSASITDDGEFIVNVNSIFEGNIYSSGSITAEEILVGNAGTPTIFSNNNLNLSASNAVVVTDSPLRLNPMTNESTASFTLSAGDIIYSSTEEDFLGYKNVNGTGSWSSLTVANVAQIDWDYVNGKPQGLISASSQIGDLGGGLLSSSAQILPTASIAGTVLYEDTGIKQITGSSNFTYTAGTNTLSVTKLVADEIVANNSLSEPGNSTGSFGRVETDKLNINGALEFPSGDAGANQVLKTDGNGTLGFQAVGVLLGNDDLASTGNYQLGTGSVLTDWTVSNTLKVGNPVHTTLNNQSLSIDTDAVLITSSGSVLISSSIDVTIQDVLVLPERTENPSNPADGSMIVSSSGGQLRPYFWDGSAWKGISFTS